MKYGPDKNLLFEMLLHCPIQPLAALIQLSHTEPSPVLVPIPLHPTRKKIRGFNQAEVVGEYLSQLSPTPFISGVVVRNRDTPQQAHIPSKIKRAENIRGAFDCVDQQVFKQKSIILVDDVVTTGATAKEVLKAIGKTQNTTSYVVCLAHERV